MKQIYRIKFLIVNKVKNMCEPNIVLVTFKNMIGLSKANVCHVPLLFAVLAFVGYKQLGAQGVIKGTIMTSDGDPIENVCIDVLREGRVVKSIKTDKNGHYTVEELHNGDYGIIVHYRMEEKTIDNIQMAHSRIVHQKIMLVKKDPVLYFEDENLASMTQSERGDK